MAGKDLPLVGKIRKMMPVRMSSPELEDNQQFAQLLLSLSCHLTDDGVSTQLEADLEQAKLQVQAAREQWLQQHVLYQELSALVMSYELKDQEEMTSEEEEVYTLLRDSVTYAEIGDYLEDRGESGPNSAILGLNRQELAERNPYKQHMPSLQQKFLPELEGRLREKCEQLVKFYFPLHQGGDQKLQLAKAGQLPALIETDTRNLEKEKKLLRTDKLNREKQFWLYFEGLMDSVDKLEKLILTHKLKIRAERDEVTGAWLTARCDTLCLKIKTFEMELLTDTYKPNAVKALRSVEKHLNQKDGALKKELIQVSETLKSYESVGDEFNSLVEQYSRLRNELENNQWAIKELEKSTGMGP